MLNLAEGVYLMTIGLKTAWHSSLDMLSDRHPLQKPLLQQLPIPSIKRFIFSPISNDEIARQTPLCHSAVARATVRGIGPLLICNHLVARCNGAIESEALQFIKTLVVEDTVRCAVEIDDGAGEFMVADLLAGVPFC